jgi:hypothetical protein
MSEWAQKNYRDNSLPWISGGLVGVLAFLATFLLVRHFLIFGQPWKPPVELEPWKVEMWINLNAHHVPIDESLDTADSGAIVASRDIISGLGGRYTFLYVLPPILLFTAGLFHAAARQSGLSWFASSASGAMVSIGYAVATFVAVGTSSFQKTAFGIQARIGPAFVESFAFAALGYPIVFGGLGGFVYFIGTQLNHKVR